MANLIRQAGECTHFATRKIRNDQIVMACHGVGPEMVQVLDASAYCHAQQLGPVIHRDLQPESVLVEDTEEGNPRGLKAWVTCFGLQPLFDLHGLGGSLPSSCLQEAQLELS